MMRIALFGGTSEGREIAEYIDGIGRGSELTVYTATEYGAGILRQGKPAADEKSLPGNESRAPGYEIRCGRMDEAQMAGEFMEKGAELVIDATHPYATEVTGNIIRAVEQCAVRGFHTEYMRVEREGGISERAAGGEEDGTGEVIKVSDPGEAARVLCRAEGNILLTTGAKELEAFCGIEDLEDRLYLRILPDEGSLSKALETGINRSHILCMQGPFSCELNRALIREYDIKYLVTKASGQRGGFPEKLEAARAEGIKVIVIDRPGRMPGSYTPGEALECIGELFAKEEDGGHSVRIDLHGKRDESKSRIGITTGTCAALAARASAVMAVSGRAVSRSGIITPAGVTVDAGVLGAEISEGFARCGVKKYAGSDPDVTDGLVIYASVALGDGCDGRAVTDGEISSGEEECGILIRGGQGVGIVTRPGLGIEVGEAAINPVPCSMIRQAVREVFDELGYEGGATVTVSVPGGEETAVKTFNPVLGIEGGISIIGTTGIVEPMSSEAFVQALAKHLDVLAAENRKRVVFTPGSIGEKWLKEGAKEGTGDDVGDVSPEEIVQCGNHIGDALELAVKRGFKEVVLAGHAGKLVKVAAGVMNTHSHLADARMETLSSHAAMAGMAPEGVREIMDCISTGAAMDIIDRYGLKDVVMGSVIDRIRHHVRIKLNRDGAEDTVFRVRIAADAGI